MKNQETTSRGRLLDAVNLICEEIALSSHCQELLNVYKSDLDLSDSDRERTEVSDKIEIQTKVLENSISVRRAVMKKIYENYKGDHEVRCSLKHGIGAYQFATECLYANKDDGFWLDIQQRAYNDMVGILGLFCGVKEFITCSRCLEDELLATESVPEKTDNTPKTDDVFKLENHLTEADFNQQPTNELR